MEGEERVSIRKERIMRVLSEGSTADTELLAEVNGRFIFKHVDFEIRSERASQTAPTKIRRENWEYLDSK